MTCGSLPSNGHSFSLATEFERLWVLWRPRDEPDAHLLHEVGCSDTSKPVSPTPQPATLRMARLSFHGAGDDRVGLLAVTPIM